MTMLFCLISLWFVLVFLVDLGRPRQDNHTFSEVS